MPIHCMKKLIYLNLFLFICFLAKAQTVPPDSLRYCEGKVITVCSKVTSTFITKGAEKTTFLNFGNFPNQLFTVIIYEEDLGNFKYDPAVFLANKNVCVTGDVIMRDSGPEIIVELQEQIEVQE